MHDDLISANDPVHLEISLRCNRTSFTRYLTDRGVVNDFTRWLRKWRDCFRTAWNKLYIQCNGIEASHLFCAICVVFVSERFEWRSPGRCLNVAVQLSIWSKKPVHQLKAFNNKLNLTFVDCKYTTSKHRIRGGRAAAAQSSRILQQRSSIFWPQNF